MTLDYITLTPEELGKLLSAGSGEAQRPRPSRLFQMQSAASSQMELSESAAV